MRDLVAAIVAVVLLLVAASLATTLTLYRRRRQRARDSERALGRTIITELPISEELVIFSEDGVRFHYGERSIDKDLITAATLLINGAAVAKVVSQRATRSRRDSNVLPAAGAPDLPTTIDDRPE